jgi:predicted membrane metal-binding protein
MSIATAAGQQAAGLSPGQGLGLSIGAVALLVGLAIAMHHKRKSPRIIGWLAFIVGIPLAGLLSGPLGALGGVSLLAIPVSLVLTGYVAFVFLHDGFRRGGGGGGRGTVAVRGSGGGGGSAPHRWLQPLFGLILPALLLTLGGSVGNGIHSALHAIEGGVGSAVNQTTGQ